MNQVARAVRFIVTLAVSLSFVTLFSTHAYAQQNLALNKTVTASSIEKGWLNPENAVDGVGSTRWSSAFADDQWIAVDLGATHQISGVKLNWQNSFGKQYHIQTSADGRTWTTVFTENNGTGGIDNISLNHSARHVRMFGLKRHTKFGFSLWEMEVYGPQATAAQNTGNVARNKKVTSSSNQHAGLVAANAVDGSTTSRWSSAFSDNQWLAIDLGTNHQINRVKLNWQNSHAVEYQLQTSTNGSSWTTVHHQRSGKGGIEEVSLNASGRYVRMLGIKRFTTAGFSLWEMEVYGAPSSANSSSSTPSAGNSSSSVSSSSSSKSSSSADTSAPTVPGSVKTTPFASRIEVSWNASTDNVGVTGYEVYRNNSKVADLSGAVRLYVDNNVTQNTSYSYSIRARDAAGNWSARSANVTASLPASSSSSSSSGQVTLTWSSPNARENGEYLELDQIGGYEIRYKRTTDSSYTVKVIPGSRTNSINLGTLTGTYQYEIAAYDTNGLYSTFVPIKPR